MWYQHGKHYILRSTFQAFGLKGYNTICERYHSVLISFDDPMAEANAEHWFAFIAFDCSVNSLATFVTHFSAYVPGVDGWLLTRCEPMSHHLVIPVHAQRELNVLSKRLQPCG
jgi:hypothetical protein